MHTFWGDLADVSVQKNPCCQSPLNRSDVYAGHVDIQSVVMKTVQAKLEYPGREAPVGKRPASTSTHDDPIEEFQPPRQQRVRAVKAKAAAAVADGPIDLAESDDDTALLQAPAAGPSRRSENRASTLVGSAIDDTLPVCFFSLSTTCVCE